MAKKMGRRKVPRLKSFASDRESLADLLLGQSSKALVDVLVKLAMENSALRRRLEDEFGAVTPIENLAEQTRQAIDDATDFDDREINYNFDYDSAAYTRAQKNFEQMVLLDLWADVMPLAIELMKKGSYQIEMSDEGMMTADIEACLQPVIAAMTQSNLPKKKIIAWCDAMAKADRIGCVCDQEISELRDQFSQS